MSSFRFSNLQIASSFRRGSRGKASPDDLNGMIWSPTEYKLKFVLDNFPLPQVVEVVQGYLISDEDSIASGQILTLHGQKKIEKLVGYDSRNVEVNIPVTCPFKIRLRAENDRKIYPTVKDLCNCVPLPKCVEITDKPEFTNSGLRKGDLLLVERIETNFQGEPKGIMFMTTDNRRTINLAMHVLCHFRPSPLPCDMAAEYLVKDLVEQRGFPFLIEFVEHSDRETLYAPSLGVIQITDVESTSIVLASSKVETVRFAMTFPIDLPLTIKVAQGMLENSDTYARVCQELHESIDLRRYDNLTLSDPYVTGNCFYGIYDELPSGAAGLPLLPHHHSQWTPPSSRRRSNPSRSSSSLDSEDSEDRKNRKAKKNNLKTLLFANKKRQDSVQHFPRSISLPNAKANIRPVNPSTANSSPYLLPHHVGQPYIEAHASGDSDCSDLDNYDEIAHCMDAHYYRRISGATRDSSKSSTDSGVSLPVKGRGQKGVAPKENEGSTLIPCAADRMSHEGNDAIFMHSKTRTLQKSGDAVICTHSESGVEKDPRDLSMGKKLISSSSVDTYKSSTSTNEDMFRNLDNEANEDNEDKVSSATSTTTDPLGAFDPNDSRLHVRPGDDYGSIASPEQSVKSCREEIMSENEEGVCAILDKLKLSNYHAVFKDNQINGELLVDLDLNDMVQSLGLNLFEAIKLEAYIDGWRPDDQTTNSSKAFTLGDSTDTDVFCSVESLKDVECNSSSWNTNELFSRMNSINLNEFAHFCLENQINGELLKICLEKKVLRSIRDDYHINLTPLNAKKLANYVLKGWRPDTQNRPRESSPIGSEN